MQQTAPTLTLLNHLKSALGVLELDKNSQLYRDALSICDYLEKPSFRIAVFGPFNYGKSTLLNAILGNRTLPIDLIPTTGAAITVKYGNELHTRITLKDGTEINEKGTDVLKQFAILDDERRMRNDVTYVEVFCPHPFLQGGVELLDLPGTNDQEAQDNLVRDQLLTADLVIQVLDARKLMTLGERENLRDWLLDRGIKTVVFVVNFLNLLEAEEQKQIYNRLLFVAESFRSELPNNLSNLYRVDALPALRARLKGDTSAAQTTGLEMFESALQTIVAMQEDKIAIRLPRVLAIATQIQQALQTKMRDINTELESAEQKRKAKLEIKQKAQNLIKKGFQDSILEIQSWLNLSSLLSNYQSDLISALQKGEFRTWERVSFKQALVDYQQAIVKWVNQACEFFNKEQPAGLVISFPGDPQVILPNPPPNSKSSNSAAPIALATGLGWVLGGPVGAAVVGGATYFLNQNTDPKNPESSDSYLNQVQEAYANAAREYLTLFSNQALLALSEYERKADRVINFQIAEEPADITSRQHQQQLLQSLLDNLTEELEMLRQH
ncbi:dynamin family protein [Microcoleus sp. FACHB-68]|uniref:dynamin family protein n=1 Tax=Microcoleus sp. FACHB-68 TaxID=2692826 RepID=UPI00168363DF|nr:dynamin family protein [Microcoleus sp. FACHB-68]MBD1939581.1 dynamin family protein [Microcoleus sp. FACHB-68]